MSGPTGAAATSVEALRAEVAALRADNALLRSALQLGLDWSLSDGYPDGDPMVGPTERAFREDARSALGGGRG